MSAMRRTAGCTTTPRQENHQNLSVPQSIQSTEIDKNLPFTAAPPGERAYYWGEVNPMGIMDMIQSLAGQTGAAAGTDQAKVAGGFIEALTQHPEGIQSVLDAFKNNGMAEHVNSWGAGQAATATPEQVQQGLTGTGLIEKTAEKAGVSPQVVQMALATILPMVIQHFAPNGQATPTSSMGSMAQQILSKFA
jgi:uncharacterized protein YidB (DUF937 family)